MDFWSEQAPICCAQQQTRSLGFFLMLGLLPLLLLCVISKAFSLHSVSLLGHFTARVTYLGYLPLLRASGRNNFHSEASLMLIVLNPQRNHLSDLHKTHFYGILIAKKHILEKKYINGHDKSWFICILMVLSPANPVENFLCVLWVWMFGKRRILLEGKYLQQYVVVCLNLLWDYTSCTV